MSSVDFTGPGTQLNTGYLATGQLLAVTDLGDQTLIGSNSHVQLHGYLPMFSHLVYSIHIRTSDDDSEINLYTGDGVGPYKSLVRVEVVNGVPNVLYAKNYVPAVETYIRPAYDGSSPIWETWDDPFTFDWLTETYPMYTFDDFDSSSPSYGAGSVHLFVHIQPPYIATATPLYFFIDGQNLLSASHDILYASTYADTVSEVINRRDKAILSDCGEYSVDVSSIYQPWRRRGVTTGVWYNWNQDNITFDWLDYYYPGVTFEEFEL